jgi:hypothetical protein
MTTNDRRNEYRELDPAIIADFLDARSVTITTTERLATGKSNIKLTLSDGATVVARLYSSNAQSTPAREKQIASMIGNTIPIPNMLDHGDDWAVFEFAEGTTLDTQPEHSRAAAHAIAQLAKIHLDTAGWITESGDITPFNFGDFGNDYNASMLKTPKSAPGSAPNESAC